MKGRILICNALSKIANAERKGTSTTELQPVSNLMADFLSVMKKRGYIKDFEWSEVRRVRKITVNLAGKIKDCRGLTYRQDIRVRNIVDYRHRTLPTRQWGYIVITTPNGVMDHEEALEQKVGGQVVGYFW